ncbi:hypothetical protein BJ742DRAFT_12556 [Cladochytrium replicatum]|nr:hypothetical protein BJ742DRAFT_12556 [Cladochytrium replicatum]
MSTNTSISQVGSTDPDRLAKVALARKKLKKFQNSRGRSNPSRARSNDEEVISNAPSLKSGHSSRTTSPTPSDVGVLLPDARATIVENRGSVHRTAQNYYNVPIAAPKGGGAGSEAIGTSVQNGSSLDVGTAVANVARSSSPAWVLKEVETKTVHHSGSLVISTNDQFLEQSAMASRLEERLKSRIASEIAATDSLKYGDSSSVVRRSNNGSVLYQMDNGTEVELRERIKDLSVQLETKVSEVRILREIISGSVALSENMSEFRKANLQLDDSEFLNAWNMQLRQRVTQLEAHLKNAGTAPGPPPLTRGKTSEAVRSAEALAVTKMHNVYSQTSETADSVDLTIRKLQLQIEEQDRRLREQDDSIASLSNANAQLQLELLSAQNSTNSTDPAKEREPENDPDLSALNDLRQRCDELSAVVERQRREADFVASERRAKEHEFERDRKKLLERIDELDSSLQAAVSRGTSLQEEITVLQAERASNKVHEISASDSLKRKLEVLTSRLESALKDNRDLSAEARDLKARILTLENFSAERAAAAHDEMVITLENENLKIRNELQVSKEVHAKELARWQQERIELAKEVKELRETPTRAYPQQPGERSELVEQLKVDRLQLQDRIHEVELRIQEVEAARDKSESASVTLKAETDSLARDLDRSKALNLELETLLREARTEEGILKEERVFLSNALDKAEFRATEAEAQRAALESMLNGLRNGHDEAARSRESLQARMETAEMELKVARDRAEVARAEAASLRLELERTRKAQADVGILLLKMQKRDRMASATASVSPSEDEVGANVSEDNGKDLQEYVRALQERCDSLAKEVLEHKMGADAFKEQLEAMKLAAHERDASLKKVVMLEKDVETLTKQMKREKENWKLREQTLYGEVDLSRAEKVKAGQDLLNVKRMIVELARNRALDQGKREDGEEYVMTPMLLQRDLDPGTVDVDIDGWIQWMQDERERLSSKLDEAHAVIDAQHQRLEQLLSQPASAVGSTSNARGGNGVRWVGSAWVSRNTSEQEVQTDPMLAFARMSTIKAALAGATPRHMEVMFGGGNERRHRSARYGRHTSRRPSIASSVGAAPVPPANYETSQLSPGALEGDGGRIAQMEHILDQTRQRLQSSTERYGRLQQVHLEMTEHLDYQIRVNSEIKRLIVDANVSREGSEVDVAELIQRYNDALVQIGGLQEEMLRWKSRCEEVEEVVEAAVLRQSLEEREEFEEESVSGIHYDANPEKHAQPYTFGNLSSVPDADEGFANEEEANELNAENEATGSQPSHGNLHQTKPIPEEREIVERLELVTVTSIETPAANDDVAKDVIGPAKFAKDDNSSSPKPTVAGQLSSSINDVLEESMFEKFNSEPDNDLHQAKVQSQPPQRISHSPHNELNDLSDACSRCRDGLIVSI